MEHEGEYSYILRDIYDRLGEVIDLLREQAEIRKRESLKNEFRNKYVLKIDQSELYGLLERDEKGDVNGE